MLLSLYLLPPFHVLVYFNHFISIYQVEEINNLKENSERVKQLLEELSSNTSTEKETFVNKLKEMEDKQNQLIEGNFNYFKSFDHDLLFESHHKLSSLSLILKKYIHPVLWILK